MLRLDHKDLGMDKPRAIVTIENPGKTDLRNAMELIDGELGAVGTESNGCLLRLQSFDKAEQAFEFCVPIGREHDKLGHSCAPDQIDYSAQYARSATPIR